MEGGGEEADPKVLLAPLLELRQKALESIKNSKDTTEANNKFIEFVKQLKEKMSGNTFLWEFYYSETYSDKDNFIEIRDNRERYNNLTKYIEDNGFAVEHDCEGGTFLVIDYGDLMEKFGSYLSPTLSFYYQLVDDDEKESYTCEGGLTISFSNFAKRIARWERFSAVYPNFILKNELEERLNGYIWFLIQPHDNYMPFDSGPNEKKINPSLLLCLKEYRFMYPNTKFGSYLKGYMYFLKENDYEYKGDLVDYIEDCGTITGYGDGSAHQQGGSASQRFYVIPDSK